MYKYKFKATFDDGSIFEQDPNDKSYIDPVHRTSFFDYLELCKEKKPILFYLYNDKIEYIVNLNSGEIKMSVGDCGAILNPPEPSLNNFRIIYFRTKVISFNVGFNIEGESIAGFKLGWQANDSNGNNVQRVIEIT